ncbi:MAG: hypothetical protein Q8891_03645 [Bacteroidota bacterium]|nr:hypothetical protein [Bacteroidota bacterium]
MKQKFLTIPCLLLLAIILITASCSKTGPAGPAGATGPAGAAGAAGATGATGTANVMYSPWLNDTFYQRNLPDTNWYAGITANMLTASIINSGEVKVYLNLGSDSTNGQEVVPLPTSEPFNFAFNSQSITLIINPYFLPQLIGLISNYDASSYMSNGYNYFQVRYIIIPGGVSTGRNAAINWKDYNAVKKYLGLKD